MATKKGKPTKQPQEPKVTKLEKPPAFTEADTTLEKEPKSPLNVILTAEIPIWLMDIVAKRWARQPRR
jgi:hypothetical protein